MKITRHFTIEGQDALKGINFVPRVSRISKLDGTIVFEAKDVLVPDFWSQVAVDILAQKYFRRKGINAENGGETDSRQVFHRLAGCWRHWGETHGYFDSAQDGQAFYDELVYMLAKQMCAPNSPQWFNTGLHFAYGIEGPAQGHSYVDSKTGKLKNLLMPMSVLNLMHVSSKVFQMTLLIREASWIFGLEKLAFSNTGRVLGQTFPRFVDLKNPSVEVENHRVL